MLETNLMDTLNYKVILDKFKAPNFDDRRSAELIEKYGSLNNAVICLTSALPFEEVERLQQFLYQEITDGTVVYALEKVIITRSAQEDRKSMRRSIELSGKSARYAAISAIASVVVAICMLIGLMSGEKHEPNGTSENEQINSSGNVGTQ